MSTKEPHTIPDELLFELTKRWDVPMPFADARQALREAYEAGFKAGALMNNQETEQDLPCPDKAIVDVDPRIYDVVSAAAALRAEWQRADRAPYKHERAAEIDLCNALDALPTIAAEPTRTETPQSYVERECDRCDGTGGAKHEDGYVICVRCFGRGKLWALAEKGTD